MKVVSDAADDSFHKTNNICCFSQLKTKQDMAHFFILFFSTMAQRSGERNSH